jgi:hypothetical protein
MSASLKYGCTAAYVTVSITELVQKLMFSGKSYIQITEPVQKNDR